MGLLLLVLLCASGCDRLLGLGSIQPVNDGRIATDAARDAAADAGPPPCAPTTATLAHDYSIVVVEAAYSEDASYDVYQASGSYYYQSPIGDGIATKTNAGGTNLALSRDGGSLFVANGTGGVDELRMMTAGAFSTPVTQSALAGTLPGSPATLGAGELAMVVASTATPTMFQEWRRPTGGAWTAASPPFLLPGIAEYPSLSADGLVLTYIEHTPQGAWSVQYLWRDRIETEWSAATPSTGALITDHVYAMASPWISADCKRLYVVRYATNTIQQYTLQ